MRNRTPVRMLGVLVAAVLAAVLALSAGCSSSGSGSGESTQTPVAQPGNPLVPANTARGTVDNANNAINETQNQVNQY